MTGCLRRQRTILNQCAHFLIPLYANLSPRPRGEISVKIHRRSPMFRLTLFLNCDRNLYADLNCQLKQLRDGREYRRTQFYIRIHLASLIRMVDREVPPSLLKECNVVEHRAMKVIRIASWKSLKEPFMERKVPNERCLDDNPMVFGNWHLRSTASSGSRSSSVSESRWLRPENTLRAECLATSAIWHYYGRAKL